MYKFNKETLEFVKLNWPHYLFKGTFTIIMTALIAIMLVPIVEHKKIDNEIKVIITRQNEFNTEKLIKLITSLHFPFPYIVLAQTMHETQFFTSPVFKENNNLFGMKVATIRITTSIAKEGQYAYYNTWMDSVYDRALYSATYLSSIKTEDEYYSYLRQYYAEDSRYVEKLKALIVEKNLKSKFKQ
jgi:uncharacterized FlgJ-related protein